MTRKANVVNCGTLRPGMRLAESIVDASRRLILREGTTLSRAMIESLPIWGVFAVAVEDLSPGTRFALEGADRVLARFRRPRR